MKKLAAIFIAGALLASSIFAFEFSAGGKVLLGANIGDSFSATAQSIKTNKTVDFGGGGYVNFTFLGPLGVQLEMNFIGSNLTFSSDSITKADYNTFVWDVPVMVWLSFDMWRFTLGFGAGLNVSTELAHFSDVKTFTKDLIKLGFVGGLDIKFFINDHFALVLSGRFVANFETKDLENTSVAIDYTRRSLYGGLGLEFRVR